MVVASVRRVHRVVAFLFVIVLIALALGPAPSVQADGGLELDENMRLQGEWGVPRDAACTPEYRAMAPRYGEGADAGAVMFFPNRSCIAEYEDVVFATDLSPSAIRMATKAWSGSGWTDEHPEVRFYVDGVLAGITHLDLSGSGDFATVTAWATTIEAGVHDLSIEVIGKWSFYEGYLDFVEFAQMEVCPNTVGSDHGVLQTDLILDSFWGSAVKYLGGWADGEPYHLNHTGPVDPEGDSYEATWVWSDGVTATGPEHGRTVPPQPVGRSPNAYVARLDVHVVEDASGRCGETAFGSNTYTLGPYFLIPLKWPDAKLGTARDPTPGLPTGSCVAAPPYVLELAYALQDGCLVQAHYNGYRPYFATEPALVIGDVRSTQQDVRDDILYLVHPGAELDDGVHLLELCHRFAGDVRGLETCSAPAVLIDH